MNAFGGGEAAPPAEESAESDRKSKMRRGTTRQTITEREAAAAAKAEEEVPEGAEPNAGQKRAEEHHQLFLATERDVLLTQVELEQVIQYQYEMT